MLYNLYYRGTNGVATLVSIGGTTYTTLAAWQAAQPTLNAGSLEGNPDFINPAGADGILGGPDTALGGGLDDDFTPGKGSPAIDASDAYLQLHDGHARASAARRSGDSRILASVSRSTLRRRPHRRHHTHGDRAVGQQHVCRVAM